MPLVLETFTDFKQRMGCDHLFVRHRYLFENGGTSDGQHRHYDPPEDARERSLLQREFIEAKLEDEIKAWNSFKTAVANQARFHANDPFSAPPPDPQAPAKLAAGRERIRALKQRLEELKMADPVLADRRAWHEEALRRQHAAFQVAEQFLQQIAEIRL